MKVLSIVLFLFSSTLLNAEVLEVTVRKSGVVAAIKTDSRLGDDREVVEWKLELLSPPSGYMLSLTQMKNGVRMPIRSIYPVNNSVLSSVLNKYIKNPKLIAADLFVSIERECSSNTQQKKGSGSVEGSVE